MVRVHRWMLDEKRRTLVSLEQFVGKLRGELEVLNQQIAAERDAASRGSFESQTAYAAFHAASEERRRRLSGTIDNLQREVEAARDEVNETFRELKGYEGAREKAIERQVQDRARRDQLALDETSIGIYRRRGGPKLG